MPKTEFRQQQILAPTHISQDRHPRCRFRLRGDLALRGSETIRLPIDLNQ